MKKISNRVKNKILITFIFGTRPEIIKLSPLIKLCQKRKIPFKIIHSGQHYSYNMDKIFFKSLNLPKPDYSLEIKSKEPFMQGEHTGRMLIEIEKILLKDMPFCVVVQGDTNTALSGALTAEKISTTKAYTGFDIKVAHVEAGLRSFDRSMPEEINRFLIDHIADFLFIPTKDEKRQLLKEGASAKNIYVAGNTVVDALVANLKAAHTKRDILKNLDIKKSKYILLTLHRQENVDSKTIFSSILKGVEAVSDEFGMPVIFPAHPRTIKKIKNFNIKIKKTIKITEPTDFLSFLYLEANAGLILTDSGGVQEEACVLKVPCVTLRKNTERPQTVKVGSNIVGGVRRESILQASMKMINKNKNWRNPLGDGKASEKILDVLLNSRD